VIKVHVKHYVIVRDLTGVREDTIELKEPTLERLINKLVEKYGYEFKRFIVNSKGELQGGIIIAINNTDARWIGGLRAQLKNGDTVTFLPPVSGG